MSRPRPRPHEPRPLAGLRIVVCRPRSQARPLVDGLGAAGAAVVAAPVIAIAAPDDGGAALRAALARLTAGDWLVVTSPNGADRVAAAGPVPGGASVAAIGPGTARRATELGLTVHLVPERSIAEGLLESFPTPDDGSPPGPPPRRRPGPASRLAGQPGRGLVVLARAVAARPVLPDGLRAAGWEVLDVAAYRTVGTGLTDDQRRDAAAADGVVFTSSSTVDHLVAEIGADSVPPLVASIGPATSATAARYGLDVTVEAVHHTIDGLVAALVAHAASWSDEGDDQ